MVNVESSASFKDGRMSLLTGTNPGEICYYRRKPKGPYTSAETLRQISDLVQKSGPGQGAKGGKILTVNWFSRKTKPLWQVRK